MHDFPRNDCADGHGGQVTATFTASGKELRLVLKRSVVRVSPGTIGRGYEIDN